MIVGSIVVRAATEEDMAEIARIYGHYVVHTCATFETEAPSREEMAKRRAGILALGLPYLAAEDEGRVIGYAYANAFRPRAAYRFTVEDSIYLDPAAVGRGSGHKLLEALIEQCGHGPWQQMIAVIGDSQNAASVGLHRRFGFREVGTLSAVGFKLGRWVDTVLMQRALGTAAR
jgi:phosphinothricin acetyltransferase